MERHPDDKPSKTYMSAYLAAEAISRLPGVNFTASGLENLPKSGAFILALTHHNSWDAPVLGHIIYKATRRPVHFLTREDFLAQETLFGRLIKLAHGLPINGENPDLSQIKNAIGVLENGHVLGIAPEAGLVAGDKVKEPLKRGVGFIAIKAGAPIVPVGMAGRNFGEFHSKLAYLPRSLHVHISETIEVNGGTKNDSAVVDERLRFALQQALDEAYSQYEKVHGSQAASRLDRS